MISQPIIAIYLAEALRALELAELLKGDGMQPIVTTSSDEFYELLNRERVDLVVIEHQLRGFLTGLEILERLHGDLLRPATFLLANITTNLQRRADKIGVDRLLPTNTRLDELGHMARTVINRATHTAVPIKPAARRLVQQSEAIHPLPQLLVKLCRYLHDDNMSLTDLARDISVDPRVTAELLRLTNSAAFGRAQKTTNVLAAVNFLGVRKTVSLVLSAGMIRAQNGLLRSVPDAMRWWYNYRSVLIGSTAAVFAGRLENVSSETAYILGLLQDVGTLILAQAYAGRYQQTLDRVRQIGQLRLENVEQVDFNLTHADVSAALLQKWELPQSLISIVLNHHDAAAATAKSGIERSFTRAMQIGEAVANLLDSKSPQRFQSLNQLLASYGPALAGQCKDCLAEAVNRAVESSQLFHIAIPDEGRLRRLMGEFVANVNTNVPGPPVASDTPEPLSPATNDEPSDAADESADNESLVAAELVPSNDEPTSAVLVIDDEQRVARMIHLYLAPLRIKVLTCDTLDEARQLSPQVQSIFCDVHLGAERGDQVVRQLRDEGFAGKVIMISGDGSINTVRQCIAAGIDGYLLKPFDKAALLAALHKQRLLHREPVAV